MHQQTVRLHDRLRASGFRQLSAAELASGPFAVKRGELRCLRLHGGSYSIARLAPIESDREAERFVEELNWDSFGYDLNIGRQAHLVEQLNELLFLVAAENSPCASELTWRGYRQHGVCWVKSEDAYPIPALDEEFAGEIFPSLGWVPMPGETSEFGKAEQRRGFCSRIVPDGAQSLNDVRGYRFIYGGYPERFVPRRQIVVFVDDGCDPRGLVDEGLALTYGDS